MSDLTNAARCSFQVPHSNTSYLSDEDLLPQEILEDGIPGLSSKSSVLPPQFNVESLEMQLERAAYQHEVVQFLMNKKASRKAAKRSRSARSKTCC
ncbi:hypothetical protein QBC37DRAFT_435851 [Rhypophila decipiens]|uniref:Uncharacterized protein n=1 Tax=Rhypophila decipiens TaxID=261697 RepID=A0AAN6XYB6_9PEZI|nr:hypothetical protein QBC37DRAFT_435851 [Rhypophila decipiens]